MKKDIFGSFLILGASALILTSCQKDAQEGSSVKATSNNNQVINANIESVEKLENLYELANKIKTNGITNNELLTRLWTFWEYLIVKHKVKEQSDEKQYKLDIKILHFMALQYIIHPQVNNGLELKVLINDLALGKAVPLDGPDADDKLPDFYPHINKELALPDNYQAYGNELLDIQYKTENIGEYDINLKRYQIKNNNQNVNILFKKVDGFAYSFDIIKKNGEAVRPCLNEKYFKSVTQKHLLDKDVTVFEFTGICKFNDKKDEKININEIKEFLLCRKEQKDEIKWSTPNAVTCDIATYDNKKDVIIGNGVTAGVIVAWPILTNGGTQYEYSLDIKYSDNNGIQEVSKCIDSSIIKNNYVIPFMGKCLSAGNKIYDLANITAIRVCGSYNKFQATEDTKCSDYFAYNRSSDKNRLVLDFNVKTQNNIILNWMIGTALGYAYSIDLITDKEENIAGCLDAATLDKKSTFTFDGYCVRNNVKDLNTKYKPKFFRLCKSKDFSAPNPNIECITTPNHVDQTMLNFKIGGSQIDIFVNKKEGYKLSLDLISKKGDRDAACIGFGYLGNSENGDNWQYKYKGTCLKSNVDYNVEDIKGFQLCYDKGDGKWECTPESPIIDSKVNFVIP